MGNAPCAGASAPPRHESCLQGRDRELTLRSHSRSSRWEAASRGRARQDVFCVVFAISSFPAAGQFRASPWRSATAPLLCRTCSGFPQWGPWGAAPSAPSGVPHLVPGRTWQRHWAQKPPKAVGLQRVVWSCALQSLGSAWCPATSGPSAEPWQGALASAPLLPPGVLPEQPGAPRGDAVQLCLQRLPGLHPARGGPPRPDAAADVCLQAHSHAQPGWGGARPLPVSAAGGLAPWLAAGRDTARMRLQHRQGLCGLLSPASSR